MDARHQGRLSAVFSVFGIAVVWAAVAAAVQLLADRVVLHMPFSIMPPRWWWYSPLPWPQSILTAALFAAASATFVLLCVRGGIAVRRVLVGMGTGLAALWVWALMEGMGFLTYFGALQGLSFIRMSAAVRLSGIFGSVVGALVGTYAVSRRGRLSMPEVSSTEQRHPADSPPV